MAQSSGSASLLESVGQSFLDAASSIDANIDASSLVDRLAGADADPTSRKVQQTLAELKELVRRAPAAVVASQGAVPAVLRVVMRLGQACGQEDAEDDGAEALQDALEIVGLLLGEGGAVSAAGSGSQSPGKGRQAAPEDEAARRRGLEVAEATIRHTENGKQLLRILSARDVSTQYDAMVVLQRIYIKQPEPINTALLADPMAINRLMQILQSCPIDYVRNESLSLLLLLTASNPDIQQIVTMQGLADTLFAMLGEEDLGKGGKVARDLVRCLTNLVGSTTCQRCIRETGGIAALISATSAALEGKRAPLVDEDEEEEEDGFSNRLAFEVPEEARWSCFLLLSDVVLLFAGAGAGAAGGAGVAPEGGGPEVAANRDALVRNGALDLLRQLSDARVSFDAKLRLVRIMEALEPVQLAAKRLEHASPREGAPLLSSLASILVTPGASLELKSALSRVLCRTIARHPPLQLSLLASLSPQLGDMEPGETIPAGRQVVSLLERAAEGRPDPQQLWFAFHLVLAMLLGNASVQSALPTMRIALPGEGPAELGLDLILASFSGCARKCLDAAILADDDVAADAGSSESPDSPAAALLAALKLMSYWLASCPQACAAFASSPVTVPRAMDLMMLGNACGSFFRVHLEGLAALLMGICIKAEEGAGSDDVAALMALVAKKIGIEDFQGKVERLIRSDVLQRPPRSLANFRWYNSRFRSFLREQQQAVQRRMVQLYVAEGIGGGGSALSEDVADQYKQLIRVQDEKFREVQHENEQLRAEVEAFMRRSLQASSVALAEKAEAARLENEALHREVAQLERESAEHRTRLERELRQARALVAELEQQRQSMAVGYEQVERTSEDLRRELEELRAAQRASERVGRLAAGAGSADDPLALAGEVEEARRRAEELQRERTDLLELLGCIVAACPDAARFVAPLGLPAGSGAAAASPATDSAAAAAAATAARA